MKKVIIAIGGGEIGRTKTFPDGTKKYLPNETMAIDNEIIRLSNKANPRLLYIGAANNDSDAYYGNICDHFAGVLKCDVSRLNLATGNLSFDEIESAIMNTDIVYIGGGDTKLLIETLRNTNTDKILNNAYNNGIIISGLSAGAICWFDWYDNDDYIDGDMSKIDVLAGLGYISGFCVPHWNKKSDEDKKIISDMLTSKGISGIGLDNNCALIFEDEKIRFLTSTENAKYDYLPLK